MLCLINAPPQRILHQAASVLGRPPIRAPLDGVGTEPTGIAKAEGRVQDRRHRALPHTIRARRHHSSRQTRMMKTILVLGATGTQGGSLVTALRPSDADGAPEFQLLALTRTPTSPGARRLAAEPHVKVVQGDLGAPASMRRVFDDAGGKGSIWGVFVVLAFPGLGANADAEERQGLVCVLLHVRRTGLTSSCSSSPIWQWSTVYLRSCSPRSSAAARRTTTSSRWTAP